MPCALALDLVISCECNIKFSGEKLYNFLIEA